MSDWAILLAAGRGERLGSGLAKQWLDVDGRRAVDRVVNTASAVVDGTVLVLPPGARWDGPPVHAVAVGGATRAQSVRAGLALIPDEADVVIVHDAAHPLASAALFQAVVHRVRAGADAAVCVLPMTQVVQVVRAGRIVSVLPKDGQVLAQSPAAFRAGVLRAAHATAPESTEDVALVVAAGGRVVAVWGESVNLHVTTPSEWWMANSLATAMRRSGTGPLSCDSSPSSHSASARDPEQGHN